MSSAGGFAVQPTAAVHAVTKLAVRAVSERLRKESSRRCPCIYPGVVTSARRWEQAALAQGRPAMWSAAQLSAAAVAFAAQ